MINMYDFITSNASYFNQMKFGRDNDVFIDYLCPIEQPKMRVWIHKNCLMYVVRGAKGYDSLDSYHRSTQGEVLFFRKGGYLIFQDFDEPYRALIFMFGDDVVKSLLTAYPNLLRVDPHSGDEFMGQPEILPLECSNFVESVFHTALKYLEQPDKESHISLEFKFKELMVNLLRNKQDNAFYLYLSWLSLDDKLPFIKLMRENAPFNFTTKDLARVANMSLSTFKRTFKKHFEMSPGQWLHEQRITKAKSLLHSSEHNVSDIAFELGYSDLAAFSKGFKKATGLTPTEYIARHG